MAVKLRLQRHGRKKRPFYHIVVADSRSPRNGRFIERLGWYNPMEEPALVDLDRDKVLKWLRDGAQPTDTVRSILSHTGVMYKKHLQRGVDKGALTQEQADDLLVSWLKNKKSQAHKDGAKITMQNWRIPGEEPDVIDVSRLLKTNSLAPLVAEVVEETVTEEAVVEETVVEETVVEETVVEEATTEETPVAETPAEEDNTKA